MTSAHILEEAMSSKDDVITFKQLSRSSKILETGSYSRTSRWMIQTQEMKRRCTGRDSADGFALRTRRYNSQEKPEDSYSYLESAVAIFQQVHYLKITSRSMIAYSGISQKFWAEAVNTACYTQNRSMINLMHDKTPYEIWNSKKPDISYFRVFGCKCFIHNNGKKHLTAFESKSDAGIFLGYSSVSKAYRVFNNRSLTVEESAHVVFDETSFKSNSATSLHDLCSRLESTSLEESDDDVPQRYSAEEEQPTVVTTHNIAQQDLTAAGVVATNVQPDDNQSDVATTDVDKQDVAQAVASASPLVSRPTPEAPAGSTNYQVISSSPAGQQGVSTSYNAVLRPTAGQPVASDHQLVSRPPADELVASTSTSWKQTLKPTMLNINWRQLIQLQTSQRHRGNKETLQLKYPAKGKPPQEHYSLICADIDLMVNLREQVIDEVAKFFYSFSLKKLAQLQIDESYFEKEALVLSWVEAESTGVALQRKMYILLKYKEVLVRKFLESWTQNFVPRDGTSAVDLKVIHLLSYLHSFILEELQQQTVAHGLQWNKTCCSQLFEGRSRTPSAAPATTNFAVSRQRSYDDTLPSVSAFLKLMKKRWGDVCLEVAEFCVSRRLLPVGSINFCRAQSAVEPVGCFVLHQPTVFALCFSQFCTVFFEYSLFSRFSSEDITSFVAFISSERTNLRSVQITTPSAVAPRVPILLDQRSSSTSSSDESMHFDDQDTATAFSLPATTLPSLPAVTTELSNSLDDLRIFLSERFDNQAEAIRQIDDAQSDVLSRLHTIKRDILSALMQQEEALRNLINTARQDGRTLDDAQTLRFNEFRKVVLAQSVSATADMLDVRKDIKALDAKVTSLDELVAATRNDLLEFRAQAQQTLNIVTDQLSELVAYINRGGNDKKGEVSSSRPPPDDQNRGSGNTGGGGDTIETLWKDLLLLIKKEKGAEGTEVDPTKEEDTVGEPWRIRIPSPGEAAEA
ncbi:hypothetical protein F511_19224 [Dorcoceras hygrometricum]|uniref:Retroviral polymerase SH3-like domain-containing protein n=1 Tax=Dorcoceras hygrometricum TaxID=472368 RepID=A0A2Z7BIA7_9LAMI|nr:hypothetical protein F511_19224 [Dorcoceras hygrometricum]